MAEEPSSCAGRALTVVARGREHTCPSFVIPSTRAHPGRQGLQLSLCYRPTQEMSGRFSFPLWLLSWTRLHLRRQASELGQPSMPSCRLISSFRLFDVSCSSPLEASAVGPGLPGRHPGILPLTCGVALRPHTSPLHSLPSFWKFYSPWFDLRMGHHLVLVISSQHVGHVRKPNCIFGKMVKGTDPEVVQVLRVYPVYASSASM